MSRRELKDQFRRERRWDLPCPANHTNCSFLDCIEQRTKSRQVEVVVEALADGLEQDRKVGELPRDLEQVFGSEPLEPERRSFGRIGARHEQGAGGVLAEAQAEKRRLGQLCADQAFRQVAGQTIQQVERRVAHRRQPEEQAVVAGQTGGHQAESLADPSQEGQLERMVQAAAKWREDGQPQLAGRVDVTLDHDGAVTGHGPRQKLLTQDKMSQARGSLWCKLALALKPGKQFRVVQSLRQLAAKRAHRLAELGRAR